MSGPLVSASAAFVAKNSRIPPFAIEQSLRFDGSARLTKDSGFSNSSQTWTWSCWAKLCTTGDQVFLSAFNAYDSTSGGRYDFATYIGSNFAYIITSTGAGNGDVDQVASPGKYRDTSAWYHFLATSDGTDRILYINGEEVKRVARTANNLYLNQARPHHIGGYDRVVTSNYYLAEAHFIDGTSYNPDNFGEYDANGVWRPIEVSGLTYGTNGFYLKFDPSATNGIGHDHSGNGNNWTPSGFDTTNTTASTYDVMSDTPTTNWCTLNPLQQSNDTTLSDGNLRFAGSVSKGMICGTQGATSGKYYWEFIVDDSGQDMAVGITNLDETVLNLGSGGSVPGRNTWSWGLYMYPLNSYIRKVHNTVYTDTSATKVSNGDVIGIAYDAGAGKMWASKNNTWMDSGDPTAGTNALFTNLTGTLAPAVNPPGGGVSTTNTANFGQRAFAYTPPTGFSALNTKNLPAPTVKDGSDYFNTAIYTGDGASSFSITGVGFQPDWVWFKRRNQAANHTLYDAVRGATKALQSSLPDAEVTLTNGLTSFDTDGFTTGVYENANTITYVAWNWLAGGSGSSIAAGSIDSTNPTIASTVSVNPSAGFSIVSYTGTGANATVGHGLGVAPAMMIIKDRDAQTRWIVYHQTQGNAGYLRLDDTAAFNSDSTVFNTTSPSSTVFSVGTSVNTNPNGNDVIAYCFAEVEGYSKMSSWTGNGVVDGPFVYCGFRPSFLLFKRSNLAEDWVITDSVRRTYNQMNGGLRPNSSAIEWSTDDVAIDFTANGFKIKSGDAKINASGSTYIFMVLSENPFGGSGVSPATAR